MTPQMQEEQQGAEESGMIGEAAGKSPQHEMAEDGPPKGAITDDEDDEREGGGAELARQTREQLEAHIPPEYRAPVERLVLAGMKAMFSPQMQEIAMRQVREAENPAAGAAVGVAALMSQLTSRVKGHLPPPAIVPAALILLTEALAFLDEGGQIELTPEMLAEATQDLSGYLMQKMGLTPDKVAEAQEVIRRSGGNPPGAARPGGAPAPSGGLVGSQMGVA